jgi:hypothetical protein
MTQFPVLPLRATVSSTKTLASVFSILPDPNAFWKYVNNKDLEKTPGIGQYNI